MNISAIKDKYRNSAKCTGSLFLLNHKDAISYIEECASSGFLLAGVEGFVITETGAVQPDQAASNDIADSTKTQYEFVRSTKILISNNKKHWFEVIFETTNV